MQRADTDAVAAGVHPRGPRRAPVDVDARDRAHTAGGRRDRDGSGARAQIQDLRAGVQRHAAHRVDQHPRVTAWLKYARRGEDPHPEPRDSPPMATQTPADDLRTLRATFDAAEPLTVGHRGGAHAARSGDARPRAGRAGSSNSSKATSASSSSSRRPQLEIALPPARSVPELATQLAAARREAAAAAEGIALLAGAGLHPFAEAEGEMNPGERYEQIEREYGAVARRQLVFAFQVHVAVGGADRTLAVYNALRAHLPELAALAANAPFHDGRDTGFASFRPIVGRHASASGDAAGDRVVGGMGPRTCAGARGRGACRRRRTGGSSCARTRPSARSSCGSPTRRRRSRRPRRSPLSPTRWWRGSSSIRGMALPSWRIEENRWVAARHGLEGTFADLVTGGPIPVRERLSALLDEIEPFAVSLGAAEPFASRPRDGSGQRRRPRACRRAR